MVVEASKYSDVTYMKYEVVKCAGPEIGKGVVDVISALNHPPKIKEVDLDPQKFLSCPEEGKPTVTSCVQVKDPDNDPINIKWLQSGESGEPIVDGETGKFKGLEDAPGIKSVTTVDPPDDVEPKEGMVHRCVDIRFERLEGAYKAVVAVFEKLHEKPGKLTTFEKWFAELGLVDKKGITNEKGMPIRSRDMQQLKFYVGECEEELGVCNRTFGYWAHRPMDQSVIDRWETTGYEPFGPEPPAEGLCDDIESVTPDRWVDVLRNPQWSDLYYRLARQYIAAELNYAKFYTDPAVEDDIQEAKDLLNDPDICEANDPGNRSLTQEDDEISQLQERLDDFNSRCSGNGLNSVE